MELNQIDRWPRPLVCAGSQLRPHSARRKAGADSDGVVTVKSGYSVAETVSRIKKDVAKKGIMFFGVIDQAKLGNAAGNHVRPSRLVMFGNPALGTTFITANPKAGLDWPVRVLVYQDCGRRGLRRLHRLRLDRQAPRHREPRQGIQDGDRGHPVGSSRGEEVRFTKERAGICDGDIRRLGGREDRSRSILEHFR